MEMRSYPPPLNAFNNAIQQDSNYAEVCVTWRSYPPPLNAFNNAIQQDSNYAEVWMLLDIHICPHKLNTSSLCKLLIFQWVEVFLCVCVFFIFLNLFAKVHYMKLESFDYTVPSSERHT